MRITYIRTYALFLLILRVCAAVHLGGSYVCPIWVYCICLRMVAKFCSQIRKNSRSKLPAYVWECFLSLSLSPSFSFSKLPNCTYSHTRPSSCNVKYVYYNGSYYLIESFGNRMSRMSRITRLLKLCLPNVISIWLLCTVFFLFGSYCAFGTVHFSSLLFLALSSSLVRAIYRFSLSIKCETFRRARARSHRARTICELQNKWKLDCCNNQKAIATYNQTLQTQLCCCTSRFFFFFENQKKIVY